MTAVSSLWGGFAIAVGGGIGALARHICVSHIARLMGLAFPWPVLLVNVLGSLAMGVAVQYLMQRQVWSDEVRLFVTVGLLGGFTTFSSFSFDAALLIDRHEWFQAALYTGGSVLLSIGGLFLGRFLMQSLLS